VGVLPRDRLRHPDPTLQRRIVGWRTEHRRYVRPGARCALIARRGHVSVVCIAVVAASWIGPAAARAAGPTVPGAPQGKVRPTTQPVTGVALVAASAPVDGRVALLVHNGTGRPVRVDRIDVTATSSGGALVTSARTKLSYPQLLVPDETALATVT